MTQEEREKYDATHRRFMTSYRNELAMVQCKGADCKRGPCRPFQSHHWLLPCPENDGTALAMADALGRMVVAVMRRQEG